MRNFFPVIHPTNQKESTVRLNFDRFLIAGVACIGLGAAAVGLSPVAAAGGADCVEKMSGTAAPCAAVSIEASGIGALPGPPIAPPPVVPPLVPPPVVPPVPPLVPPLPPVPPLVPPVPPVVPPPVPPVVPPLVPPVAAAAPLVPAAAGAPMVPMSGLGGKGVPTNPQTTGGPAAGVPTLPGAAN